MTKLTDQVLRVYDAIPPGGSRITNAELVAITGIGKRSVQRDLTVLVDAGLLKRDQVTPLHVNDSGRILTRLAG